VIASFHQFLGYRAAKRESYLYEFTTSPFSPIDSLGKILSLPDWVLDIYCEEFGKCMR